MNDVEKYMFDLNGFIVIEGCLDESACQEYLAVVDGLESHVAMHIDDKPQRVGFAGIPYRFDEKYECYSYKGTAGGGVQYVVDDFLNASSVFDTLVNHDRTMKYVREMVAGPHRIGSSELRYRYKSNRTDTHMGGRMDIRNRYQFIGQKMYDSAARDWLRRDFDLVAIRMLYALHDIPIDNGPLCVVPGSHKSNFFSPFNDLVPTEEPGMTPIPMKAGDAIFFTENLRHGGFPNYLDRARKTLHLMIGPTWAGSQSPIHWDDRVHVSREAWLRYDEAQRGLLPPPAAEVGFELQRLRNEVDRLTGQTERLQGELRAAQSELEAAKEHAKRGIFSAVRGILNKC